MSLKVIATSFSFVNSATTLAKEHLVSRHTCGPIQEKNLSVAHNANTLAHKLVLSRDTYGLTQQGKNLLVTHNATTLPLILALSTDTSGHIQDISLSNADTAL